MAFNRVKTLATAQNHVDKGQLRKAAGAYQKVCNADPDDWKTRLNLAELRFKNGDRKASLKDYSHVATAFCDRGHPLRGIAVYKKMLRVDAGLHSVHVSLARVYREMGLNNDAVSQFQEAIAVLVQRGKTLEKLYVIRELLELDDQNVRARVRLAEDFAGESKIEDAVTELRLAAQLLDRDGRTADFVAVAERLLYHEPDDLVVARRLAEVLLSQDNPQRALPRLQACFRANPEDGEVLLMLASSFDLLGQIHKAVTVLKGLARIHDRNGLISERDEILTRVLSLDSSDLSAQRLLGMEETAEDNIEELGFADLTFDELEDEEPPVGEVAAADASPMPQQMLMPTSASLDDLEVLAELAANEPVSGARVPFTAGEEADLVSLELAGPPDDDRMDLDALGDFADELIDEAAEAPPSLPPLPPIAPAAAGVGHDLYVVHEIEFLDDEFLDDEFLDDDARGEALVDDVFGADPIQHVEPPHDDMPTSASYDVDLETLVAEPLDGAEAVADVEELTDLDDLDLDLVSVDEDEGQSPFGGSGAVEIEAMEETALEDVEISEVIHLDRFDHDEVSDEYELPEEVGKVSQSTAPAEPVFPREEPLDEAAARMEALAAADAALAEVSQVTALPEAPPDNGPSGETEVATADAILSEMAAADVPDVLAGELDEFDFYLSNGLRDAALSVLQDLPAEFGDHPEVLKRRKQVAQ